MLEDAAPTDTQKLTPIYIAVMIFAGLLLLLPAGCCLIDASMWFINGFAAAAYGFAMGMMARSSRGFAAGVACASLGLTHPAWVLAIPALAGVLGLPHSVPFSPQTLTPAQVSAENAAAFAVTAAVFGLALTICLRSWIALALMAGAGAIAAGFLMAQPWLQTWSPTRGLWPSPLSFPAGILHMGIATSLWLGLRAPAQARPPAKQPPLH